MATEKTLLDAINDLVTSKTFSLEAVGHIEDLRRKATSVQTRLDDTLIENNDLTRTNHKLQTDLELMRLERDTLRKTIEANNADVAKAKVDLIRAEGDRALASAAERWLRIVFAPSVLRESIYKSIPVRDPGGYTTTAQESGTVERRDEPDLNPPST